MFGGLYERLGVGEGESALDASRELESDDRLKDITGWDVLFVCGPWANGISFCVN